MRRLRNKSNTGGAESSGMLTTDTDMVYASSYQENLRNTDVLKKRLWQGVSMTRKVTYIALSFVAVAVISFLLTFMGIKLTTTPWDPTAEYYCWRCLGNCFNCSADPSACDNPCAGHAGEDGLDLGYRINVMLVVAASCSLLCGVYIVFDILLKQRTRRTKVIYIMLCAMAISDVLFAGKFLFSSIAYLSKDYRVITPGDSMCIASGFMGQFFGLATISWNFMISVTMLYIFIYPFEFRKIQLDRYKKRMYVFKCTAYVIVISLGTSLAALLSDNISFTSDGTCWLTGGFIFAFYVPLYFYYFVSLGILVMWSTTKLGPDVKVTEKYAFFTMAFILSWLWGVIFRIDDFATGDPSIYLVFVSTFYLGFQGTINFVVYVTM